MSWRGTSVFVVIVALLGVYAWRSSPPTLTRGGTTLQRPLLGCSPERVTHLVIRTADRKTRFVRGAAGWRAETDDSEPHPDVTSLLETLHTMEPLMPVGRVPEDLERFGLAPPETHLEAWAGNDPVMVLELGDRNPAWTGLYARRADAPIIELVGGVLYWEIEKLWGSVAPDDDT